MAIQRLIIDGYGQIEPNNVTFTRDGRVEAQCALAKEEGFIAENGMLLAVDVAKKEVRLPKENEELPIALHYSSEKIYNQYTPGLKNFFLDSKADRYPRMGYLTIGEVFTTNCICYNSDNFADGAELKEALAAVKETPLYGRYSTIGAIEITSEKPATAPILKVAKATTMPDGQFGVEFQVL